MILENKESNVVAIGDIQENEVGIDAKNLSHIITILSSNLYSNPEESFLRETISNAWDSHIEAGSTEPIVLSILKNATNRNLCTISVRDFGTGISPDRFKEIYLNIGSSTKRDSNSYIGAFGIGRFSALSCSNIVYITSYYEGKAYSYIMMKNNDKINIDLVNTEDTSEHNGVDVKITNVAISKYLNAISKLYYIPNLYLNTDFSISFNDRKILKYKSFYAGAFYDNSCHILLGNVVYDLDIFKFSEYCVSSSYYINILKFVEPKFEIGELDVTPNRESLMYTDKTIDAIRNKLKIVTSELKDICKEQNYIDFDNYSDYYRAVYQSYRYICIGEKEINIRGTYLADVLKYTYEGESPLEDAEIRDLSLRIYNTSFDKYVYTFDGRIFSKSKYGIPIIKLLYDKYSYSEKPYYNFLVLPSIDGTRSPYFKDWVKDHYKGWCPCMICYDLCHSLKGFKQLLQSNSLVVKEYGDPHINWKKTLWVWKQVLKSLKSRVIYKDIVNSPEYIEFKKEKSKEQRISRVDFGKSITFYITKEEYTQMKSFQDIPSLVKWIDTRYKKCTKVYACRDDYRLSIFNDIYKDNEHIVIIAVAKTNLKYLKMLPLSYCDIEDFLTTDNKKYMAYLSIQSFLRETTSFRDDITYQMWEDLKSLSKYLPANDRDAITKYLSLRSCSYDAKKAVSTALSLIDNKFLDNSFHDLLSTINKYIKVLDVMSRIKSLTLHINSLYAYFGVKNKLFRMNYIEYKRIKSRLKIEV